MELTRLDDAPNSPDCFLGRLSISMLSRDRGGGRAGPPFSPPLAWRPSPLVVVWPLVAGTGSISMTGSEVKVSGCSAAPLPGRFTSSITSESSAMALVIAKCNNDGSGPKNNWWVFYMTWRSFIYLNRQCSARGRTSETPLIIRREAALVELLLAGRVPPSPF